jgi:cobalt-zinc-cadmium efflux system membrane fusion protein
MSMMWKLQPWLLLGLVWMLTGCGASEPGPAAQQPPVETTAGAHDGWWCGEHGVPEENCGLCSPTVAAELKEKGDWCQMHDRPDSQCFVCHPEHAVKFAALYEAKYGHAPPPLEPDAPN